VKLAIPESAVFKEWGGYRIE